jgi:hypothetical protein
MIDVATGTFGQIGLLPVIDAVFTGSFGGLGGRDFPGSGITRLAMELADMPGHPARWIASRHKRLLKAHLANGGSLRCQDVRPPLWNLSEGVMALTLIHGDKSYCTAAEEATLSLIVR